MKKTYKFSFLFFLFFLSLMNGEGFGIASFAQNKNIDSLFTLLKKDKPDTSKVNHLNKLCSEFTNVGLYDTAIYHGKSALQLGQQLNFKKGIANSFNNIGIVYYRQSNYTKTLYYWLEALKIDEELKNKKGVETRLGNIGLVYWSQGDYPKALDCFFKALKMGEELEDKNGISRHLSNIGNVFRDQGDCTKALDYDFRALKIAEELGNKPLQANILSGIGIIYYNQIDNSKALDYYSRALKMMEELGNKNGIAKLLSNIGNVYSDQKEYSKALDYFFKSLKMKEKMGDKYGIQITLGNIGISYTSLKKYNEAYPYLYHALELSDSIGSKDNVKSWYEYLSDLYEKSNISLPDSIGGKPLTMEQMRMRALYYYKRSIAIRDTLFSQENKKQLVQKEMNFEFDKKETATKAMHDKEMAVAEAEKKKQKIVIWSVAGGLVLMIVLAFFIYRSYRQKQNANKILEEKNALIENQKQLVEEKNLKITDSINYAKRIQQAILPSQGQFKSVLPESFIFFRPKDIVSGDFYWISEKNDKLLIAVADCTGHGVPGAFMSMIGNTLLNEIVNVKNISEPDQILNYLNKGIISNLHQNNTEINTQDDGMDITILAIDKTNNEITFAGANHFAYLINNNELETLQGDVFSIGGMFGNEDIKFSSRKIKIEKGLTLYLFTDGFIDQFGGEKNTKFLSGRFEKLLHSIQQQNMQQQKEKIVSAFDEWIGNYKQIDDVCVIGLRI